MDLVNRLLGTPGALRRWTWASLVANIGIIVTGALVRLTGSGLGCPTWPTCTPGSYVPHGAISHHKLIEFGNRTLTFVLLVIAVMCWLAARRVYDRSTTNGRRVRRLALIVLGGIPGQAVVGGITVRSGLNPYVVALHLLLSLALVVVLVRLLFALSHATPDVVSRGDRALTVAVLVAMAIACWLGTVVTGSGPHAGDGGAVRTGLEIETVARAHAVSVWVTVALAVIVSWRAHRGGHRRLWRWSLVFIAAILVQGTIGYVQFFTGLPAAVVLLHLLGAALAVAAVAAVVFSATGREHTDGQPIGQEHANPEHPIASPAG